MVHNRPQMLIRLNVRDGSIATESFRASVEQCPLCAESYQNGAAPRMTRSANRRYRAIHSITSSALASSAGATLSPGALAVLRLITSSYLVGVCTGRLAGSRPHPFRSHGPVLAAAQARPIPPRTCPTRRRYSRSSESQFADCGLQSSPISAILAGMLRCELSRPDRPRQFHVGLDLTALEDCTEPRPFSFSRAVWKITKSTGIMQMRHVGSTFPHPRLSLAEQARQ